MDRSKLTAKVQTDFLLSLLALYFFCYSGIIVEPSIARCIGDLDRVARVGGNCLLENIYPIEKTVESRIDVLMTKRLSSLHHHQIVHVRNSIAIFTPWTRTIVDLFQKNISSGSELAKGHGWIFAMNAFFVHLFITLLVDARAWLLGYGTQDTRSSSGCFRNGQHMCECCQCGEQSQSAHRRTDTE